MFMQECLDRFGMDALPEVKGRNSRISFWLVVHQDFFVYQVEPQVQVFG